MELATLSALIGIIVGILTMISVGIGFLWRIAQIKATLEKNIYSSQSDLTIREGNLRTDIEKVRHEITLVQQDLEAFKRTTNLELNNIDEDVANFKTEALGKIREINELIGKELTFRKYKP